MLRCAAYAWSGEIRFAAIAEGLLSAHAAADLVVFDRDDDWILKVGVASPWIDSLLDRFGAGTSECIVFGVPLEDGLELARRFDQNAVVFIERGRPPRLEFPEA